jgi:hypothetical protein
MAKRAGEGNAGALLASQGGGGYFEFLNMSTDYTDFHGLREDRYYKICVNPCNLWT